MRSNFTRFISPNQIQKELLCYSDGMGFEESPDFFIDRLSFNNYLIMYCISGKLWCHQNEQKIAVFPGETILLDLHRPHRYYFSEGMPSRIAWLHLNGTPAVQIMQQLERRCTLPVKTADAAVYTKICSFFECSDCPDPDIFRQSAECYSLLLGFFREHWQAQIPTETGRQAAFKKSVWHTISHNLNRDVTVEELAESVSLSKYHFIRSFHEAFGMPPIQFITREKIRQAKYRLTNTSDSVSDIAEAMGFTTPSYFSKVFKQVSGFSPTDYRKYGHLLEESLRSEG